MKIRPIPNWKRAWRMLTVRIALIITVFGLMPEERQLKILEFIGVSPADAPAILGLVLLVARLLYQPKAHEDKS